MPSSALAAYPGFRININDKIISFFIMAENIKGEKWSR
jgi:hypothetical protein